MSDSVEIRDRKAAEALCDYYGQVSLCRSIVDGQRGYTVVLGNGARVFNDRLGDAMRLVARAIGHGEDRDIMVVGEPEEGSKW